MKSKKEKIFMIFSIIIVILFLGVGLYILITNNTYSGSFLDIDPIFILNRADNDNGISFDISINNDTLYISDGNKLKTYNITNPESPVSKKKYNRPQGVIASYIHQKFLLEITGNRKIRISYVDNPDTYISYKDNFKTDTKMQFYKNLAFLGSGKNIVLLKLKEDKIETIKFHTFLEKITDIGIISNILAVTLEKGSFKLYNIDNYNEPVLLTGKEPNNNEKFSLITSTNYYLFVVKEKPDENEYIIKQIDIHNPINIIWRDVLLSNEKITNIYSKDAYFGVIRETLFLDIYRIGKRNKFSPLISTTGYNVTDIDFHKNYVFVSQKEAEYYLKLFKMN